MGMLKCPECNANLYVCVDVVCVHSKKILKNGNLHKTKNIATGGRVQGNPYLKCEKCHFSYDTVNTDTEKRIEEFDAWAKRHQREIRKLD